MDQKKFCAVPWNELYITSNGTYGLCCMEDQNINQQRIPLTKEIDQHWNSDYMRSVRKSFIKGEQLPQCRHCWKDENAGKISGRLRRNQQYYGQGEILIEDNVIKETLKNTDIQGNSQEPIKGLFFSVGNLCQLRCIDCSPSYSRSILKDYEKLGWDANTKNRRLIMQQDMLHNEKQHNEMLWKRVKESGSKIEWIRVQGGEPTISRPLLEFLKWYNDLGHAKHTTIFIITNSVNIKQEFIDALKPFRQVKFEISVDGYHELDEYLRYPTNWEKKEKIIDTLLKEFPGGVIHSTIYSLNLGGLPELIKWAETKPAMHSIQCLTYPDELAIQHLPEDYKLQIIEQLSPWIVENAYKVENNYDPQKYRNNCINGVVNRLKQKGDVEQWKKAKEIIRSYNTIRPNKLENLIPGLSKYI
jgi:molybdenum cofactor biosynthesis enzyme MoaA